ncbi:hypothetical protein N7507_010790 [Penicillium longicatenatum]|nr:hypothetical protein N7507_010790 [Penicillium longicatenatum]
MASPSQLQTFPSKPRVFILSDISNEPDDAESLMKNKVCPQDMHKIVDGYEKVVDNLNAHVNPNDPYPTAQYLRSIIKKGAETYGMKAVGNNIPLSDGSELLLQCILKPTEEPLWILCWGGTNVLASVLLKIQTTNSPADALKLRSKLRIYAISDQDDTGTWIRHNYPDLFYICSCGISGDKWYGFDKGGPDPSKISREWIKENIQIRPFGTTYPEYMFIPEGDTPTFLYLIQNGLGVPERPEYGSWGGRYIATDVSGEGVANGHFSDTADEVIGLDGQKHKSNQATIWRWRDAFQTDFAARMQWSLSANRSRANHHPVVVLNGSKGSEPLYFELEAGSMLRLDASASYDPDPNDQITFNWYQYRDPSATQWSVHFEVSLLEIKPVNEAGSIVDVTIPPPDKCCVELISRVAVPKGQVLHLVLEMKDNGSPALISYRRVIIQTTNEKLLGGGGGADAIGDMMRDFIANT